MNNGASRLTIVFAVIVLIGLSALGFLLLGNGQNTTPTTTSNSTITPTTMPIVSLATTSTPSPTPFANVCHNPTLKLTLQLPSPLWKCQNEAADDDGTTTVTSTAFTVQISSFGRDAFCDPGDPDPNSPRYNPTSTCELELFYFKNGIDLKTYKLDGSPKEVFGAIIAGPQISITWNNMESRQLTMLEKEEINLLLDSIKYNYVNPNLINTP